jgi:hypothetical protein
MTVTCSHLFLFLLFDISLLYYTFLILFVFVQLLRVFSPYSARPSSPPSSLRLIRHPLFRFVSLNSTRLNDDPLSDALAHAFIHVDCSRSTTALVLLLCGPQTVRAQSRWPGFITLAICALIVH